MLTPREIFFYHAKNPLIFSQYLFLFLFTIGFIIFAFVNRRTLVRNAYLLGFSLFFYYKSGGIFFFLLLFSTLVDYWCGNQIYRSENTKTRKTYLIISMVINLGLLAFFKYSEYVVSLINDMAGTEFRAVNYLSVFSNNIFGSHFDIYKIILPVGISFFTFQTMSYTIDIYRRELEPAKNLVDFGFFVSFFPQLVAGPIVRASDFIPQIYKKYNLTREQLGMALYLIMSGLFKKVFISDYISANFVDRVFEAPQLYTGFSNLMAVYGYSIQIYCDFSGYSDMAIGIAALLGFHIPINFNSPYKSTSITDFWRRWHISLSSWLRDYLYISLGGNKKGKIRTYINLMLTMLLGGLWHGAATKFIIWGGLHGAALAIHKLWMQYFPKISKAKSLLATIITGFITFHFVAYCWVYFRAENLAKVRLMFNQIFNHFEWATVGERISGFAIPLAFILLGFLIHFIPNNFKSWAKNLFVIMPDWAKVATCAAVIFIVYQAKTSDIQPFIYFQF
ncbi:MAG: MBOAT family O-acyltransferase [Bacteroidia bacterium]